MCPWRVLRSVTTFLHPSDDHNHRFVARTPRRDGQQPHAVIINRRFYEGCRFRFHTGLFVPLRNCYVDEWVIPVSSGLP